MANPFSRQASTGGYKGQNTFGSSLKRLRVARQISRRALAVISGIQERRLDALEINKEVPSYADIKALAMALDTTEAAMLETAGCVGRERAENGLG